MEKLEIKLKTLTPIWTGGVDRDCDRLHETGIIGSLRWWYEALIRGLGGKACDPTNTKCEDKDHCAACELFGCTGWSRKFRLEILGKFVLEERDESKYTCQQNDHRHRGWFINNGLKSDKFILKITPIKDISKEEENYLKTALKIMIDYAGIGAKNQLGYGVIHYISNTEKSKLETDELATIKESKQNNLPVLNEIFFGQCKCETDKIEEIIDLKCKLRNEFRKSENFENNISEDNLEKLRHFILGYVSRKEKIASKIFFSRPLEDNNHEKYMRVWGWIPSQEYCGQSRKDILDTIVKAINLHNLIELSINSLLKN